jgi:hypothetical protein
MALKEKCSYEIAKRVNQSNKEVKNGELKRFL